ncbi:hypothetical protein MAR_033350 [Mya arenaria]|uniref:Uncharacterized protein n=1 Tax=Mya arenaria TaxID=6604 RepID=A0ABY7G8T2_MYAAR|nr:hypothetical protein MAR_033350 [Mya arenaria]
MHGPPTYYSGQLSYSISSITSFSPIAYCMALLQTTVWSVKQLDILYNELQSNCILHGPPTYYSGQLSNSISSLTSFSPIAYCMALLHTTVWSVKQLDILYNELQSNCILHGPPTYYSDTPACPIIMAEDPEIKALQDTIITGTLEYLTGAYNEDIFQIVYNVNKLLILPKLPQALDESRRQGVLPGTMPDG